MQFRQQLLLASLAGALAATVGVGARQQPAQSVPPAIRLEQRIPLDATITTGQFKNGLRYFIRTTKRPEKRAELRLVVNVGSIVEEDDQRGLAHFVEHMAFNGTKHFPKQATVAFLESLGMRFGPSINAATSFDSTTYMLQVPTEKTEVLDRAFLILEDWAHGLTFEPVEIDKERGVVKEEWRVRRGAGARMQDKHFPVLLKGSRYAERLPIGTVDVIDNFKHARLTQFYKDWYRPDLMTVIAVGDFDPAVVQKMIRAHFEPIPAPVAPKPRPTYRVPDHPGTLYAIATDKEATTANVAIYSKLEARDPRTVGAYRQQLVERLFAGMLGTRFSDLAQQPGSPFIGAGAGRGVFLGGRDVSTLSAVPRGDAIDRTLTVLFTEAERVARFGFTAGELDRAKVNLMTAVDRILKEKDNTPAVSIANELVRHVTNREPVPGIAYEHRLHRQFVPAITLAEVNALARNWVPDRNRVITVSAPEREGFKVPTEAALAALSTAAIARKDLNAYTDTFNAGPLLDPVPLPGAVVKTAAIEQLGVTEWHLANGVRVVLKPTDFREDEILFRATSYGGSSLAPDADYIPASTAAAIVNAGGVGRFSASDLRKALTGKTASAVSFISDYEEGLSGTSSKKDLETLFQLIHLRFTQPRPSQADLVAMQAQMKSLIAQQRANPSFLFSEALSGALMSNHPRRRPPTVADVERIDLAKSLAFYKDRFGDAGDFTFVFVGSFDPAVMKPLVERYLGSLPSKGRKESWKDTGIRYATGTIARRVEKGLEPKSQAAIVFSGAFKQSQEQRVAIGALAHILQARLHETLREDLGGTYGVTVSASHAQIPVSQYAVNIGFSCAPERTEELVNVVFQQVQSLKDDGPTQQQVADEKEKLLRDIETNQKQNRHWVSQLLVLYQSGDTLDSLVGLPDAYRKLTPAMVQDAARLYLNPANRVTVTLFPEKKP